MKGLLFLALTANLSFSLAQATVTLGTASTYGALSYASITNTGPTDITGDIGTTGTTITGFPPGTYSGSEYLASRAIVALEDAEAAYQAVAALPGAVFLTGNLGGQQLGPGTYKYSSSAQLTGILTLVGTGSPNDAWYFQIGSTLTTGIGSAVQILAGGQPCNVFWKVGSSATIGLGTEFAGNILAAVSITMNGDSSIQGGVFALGASIMLDSNLILAQGTCPSTTSLSSSSSSSSSSLAASSTSSSSSIFSTTETSSSTSSSPYTSSSSALATQSSMSIGVSSSNPSSSSSSSASSSPTPTANSSTASSSTSSTSSSVFSLSSAYPSSSLSTSVISTVSSSVSSNSSTILPSTSSNTSVGPVLPVTSSTTSSVSNGNTTGLATTSSPDLSTTATCSGPSSVPSVTTSTVYTVRTYTVTSCAPTVTNCPALIGKVTTETISLYTTVCPISSAIRLETAVPSSYTSPVVPTNTSGGAFNPSGPVALSTTTAPLVFTTSKIPATGIATASTTAYTAAAPKVAGNWALEGAVAIVVAMMF